MKLTKLFEPGRIGKMELKNRIVMSPMGTDSYPDGFVTDRAVDYYSERARGGVGLIIAQSSQATRLGRAPGRAATWDDKFIPGLAKIAEEVHRNGGKIAWQTLYHGKLLLQWISEIPNSDEIKILGPSAIPWIKTGTAPKEATEEEIECLLNDWAEAARRIKDAGFDAIEIHGAHGYGVTQWLSPRDNRRSDKYGGSPENRARFACELISKTREKVGPNFPIILRISGSDFMPGGVTLEHSLIQAPLFVKAGVDALDISACESESTQWQYLSHLFPDGAIVYLAEAIKKVVNVPIITVGKIWDPIFAEKILKESKADFVAMGRALLADPELPNKAKEGRLNEIRRCIYCCNCLNRTPHPDYLGVPWPSCTVNTALGHGKEFNIKPIISPKKIIVIGGGISGMEAARVLAERGHIVSLYEKENILGGQFGIAAQQPQKEAYASLIENQISFLKNVGVKIFLNTEMTINLVNEARPDIVIVATGALPLIPNLPGVFGKNVVIFNDVITGKAKIGDKVLIAGGRLTAMELALQLMEQGKKVTLTTRHLLGGDQSTLEINLYRELRNRLFNGGVQIFENSPLVEIRDDGAYILFHKEHVYLHMDTAILALGVEPNNKLLHELRNEGCCVFAIGDCVKPRDALLAIREGAMVGRQVD